MSQDIMLEDATLKNFEQNLHGPAFNNISTLSTTPIRYANTLHRPYTLRQLKAFINRDGE